MYHECPNFKKTSQKLVTNYDFQKNKTKVYHNGSYKYGFLVVLVKRIRSNNIENP